MKKKEKNRKLFNYIFYTALVGVFTFFIVFETGFITSASVASNAHMFYEEFDNNIDIYEKLDYSKQLLIPKYSRYDYVKKRLINNIKEPKEDNEVNYLGELYNKYGETAIKAYYYCFIIPPFDIFNYSMLNILMFIIVIVIINLIYKKFSFNAAMFATALLVFGTISSLLITDIDFVLIIPVIIIVFINICIDYFVFDRKKVKKS